jgi:hypothetical protein
LKAGRPESLEAFALSSLPASQPYRFIAYLRPEDGSQRPLARDQKQPYLSLFKKSLHIIRMLKNDGKRSGG